MNRHRLAASVASLFLALVLAVAAPLGPVAGPASAAAQQAASIPTPEQHFGFQMGAAGKLADWDQLVGYYRLVAERSPRVMVREMGPSTLGKPFLVLFISSPQNLAHLDEIRRMNAEVADPRGVPQAEIERAIENGRAVVAQSYGLHASEVAATQTAAEMVYELATRNDEEVSRILDQTVAIMIPSLESGRRDHGGRLGEGDGGHRVRGLGPALALPPLHRPRQQPGRVHAEHGGVAYGPARSCSGTGCRRRTSTTTRWGRTARACTCRPTPSPSARTATRWCGAR